MKKAVWTFHISIRSLMLAASSAVLLVMVTGMFFTKHALDTARNQLAVGNLELAQQVDHLHAVKVALLRLQAVADARQDGRPASRLIHVYLQSQPFELAKAMMRYQGSMAGGVMRDGQFYGQLADTLERFSQLPQLDRLASSEAKVLLRDVERALRIIDDSSAQLTLSRNEHYHQIYEAIQQHERELGQLGLVMTLVILILLWSVYSLSVIPLRKLGQLAGNIGRGTLSVDTLGKSKVALAELSELRDLIQQMALDLTTSNLTITSNAALMLQLTEQSSIISSRVRGGVIEESAISKDIFGDVREMRLGNQQMQDAIDRSLEILVGASSMDCIPVRDLDMLREHLHLLSDISNGWNALGEDLSRVLDGFDDMVRDRMTLAAELERLTKEMSVCADSMIFRAA